MHTHLGLSITGKTRLSRVHHGSVREGCEDPIRVKIHVLPLFLLPPNVAGRLSRKVQKQGSLSQIQEKPSQRKAKGSSKLTEGLSC